MTSYDLKTNHPNYTVAHAASEEELMVNHSGGIRIVSLAPGQSLHVKCDAILV